MTGKKFFLILGVLAAVSFGGSTALSLFLGGGKPAAAPTTQPAAKPATPSEALLAGLNQPPSATASPGQQELAELVRDLRARIAEYDRRLAKLQEREKRLGMAEEELTRRAKDVEKLTVELAAPLTRLQKAKAELDNSRLVVGQQEQANLLRIAATFEKMDAAQGSSILLGMCQNQQIDDVVKILYYMSERSSARLLGEMTDRALAARLTGLMQRVRQAGKEG